ncbi:MAG: type II toxin-antitoxin system VapC family toxin [Pseudomonadota bacterium]|jgi:predicted nucleic-acid-binding protein
MMISFDTNALVRMLIEDNEDQAKIVKGAVALSESNSTQIIILLEVLIETVWVLESVYNCSRKEISLFLDILASTPTFYIPDSTVLRPAIGQYKSGGDFADLIIVGQAKRFHAQKLLSFDKKLQKKFPSFVVGKVL